ncbi:MAG: hypothetical protein WBW36_11845 [Candidatus Sulfotelmatobacter sp.]
MERVIEFGPLARWKRELLEALDKPWERVFAASCRIEPVPPRDISFHVGIFFEHWNEARPDRSAGTLGFVVIPVIIPGNLYIVRDAAHKPLHNVERERVLHGGAGDAGGVEVIKEGHVGADSVKPFHPVVKSSE